MIGNISQAYAGSVIASWLATLPYSDLGALAVVLVAHRLVAQVGMWAYALFALVATVSHELMHYAVAFLLGARPSFPSLIPQRTCDGWRLGSVNCQANILSAIPIALAPVVLAPFGLWWAATFLPASDDIAYAAHAWIAGTLIMASVPSRQDWRVALPSIVLGTVAYVLWMAAS